MSHSPDTTEKTLVTIIKLGLYASLITPFLTFSYLLFPFVYTKAVVFQVIIEVILVLYVPLVFLYPKYRPNINSKILWGLIVLLAVFGLATLFGVDIARSFWSTHERSTGLFALLHFFAFYLMFTSVFKDGSWKQFLRATVVAGMIMGFMSLYQTIFIVNFERSITTLGNPGFVGSYMMFIVFFAIMLFFLEENKKVRYALIAGVIMLLAAIILNATRAVFVALMVSLAAGAFLIPFTYKRLNTKPYWIIVGGGLIAGIVFVVLAVSGGLPDGVYDRVHLLGRVRDISVSNNARILTWKSGLAGLSERPLLGYGLENFSHPFNRHYDQRLIPLSSFGGTLNFDKAHNHIVEVLTTTGILGFIVYVMFFAVVLYSLFKKRRKKVAVILILLIIAFHIQNLFTFDTPTSYLLLFIALGIIGVITAPSGDHLEGGRPLPQVAAIVTPIAVVALGLSVAFFNIKPAVASHFAAIGSSLVYHPTQTVYPFYKQSLDYDNIYDHELSRLAAMGILDAAGKYTPENRDAIVFVDAVLEPGSKNDWHKLAMRARVHNLLCSEDPAYCLSALDMLHQAEKLAPFRYQVKTEQYVTYNKAGDFGNAIRVFEEAEALGFNLGSSASFVTRLGFIYAQQEKYVRSRELYLDAYKKQPENDAVLESVLVVTGRLNSVTTSDDTIRRLIEINPEAEAKIEELLSAEE